jgi:hypothetical protein
MFCNGSEVCGGGTCTSPGSPCSGSAICDENANVCTGCINNSDCGPPSYGGWGGCSGYSSDCDEGGTQSRSVTTYSCVSGTCQASTGSESQNCSRDTDGNGCESTSCSGWSGCTGFSDQCDESGSQSRTCTDYTCRSGSCQGSDRNESQGCGRSTNGNQCADPFCSTCNCGNFADDCDNSGSCAITCYAYACSGGGCVESATPQTMDCSRNTDGNGCEDGVWCTNGDQCWGGYCSPGSDSCGPYCYCDVGWGDCRDTGSGYCYL